MAGVKPVSFVSPGFDYAADQAEIDRRRRLAEMLQAQGMAPGGGTETVGGWAIKKSPLEGAGKAAQAFFGGLASKQADDLAKKMRGRQAEDFTSDRSALVAAMRGRPADQGVDDPTAGYAAPTAAQPPNPQAMEQLNFRSPMFQQLQMQQLAAQLQPPKYHVVGGSLVPEPRMGQQGPVAAAFTAPKMHALSPGQQLVPEPAPGAPGAAPAQVKPVYSAPDKDEAAKFNAILEGAGIDPASPQGQALFRELAIKTATHQKPNNVNVRTEVKTGESLAAQVGPMMKDSTAIAEGAVRQVDAARRIVQAVDTSKLVTGPGAEARLTASQIAQTLGIGGKDDAEKIANTRQAMRGLAELTLQGRQQMKGQGAITEAEGKLAEKAMSAEISLTAAEIRQLAKASERAARFNYNEHARKLKVMQDNPDLRHVAPFYQGPAMPAEAGAPPPEVSEQAREFLRKNGIPGY